MDSMNGDDQNTAIGSEEAPNQAVANDSDDESLDSLEHQLQYERSIFNDHLLHRISHNDPNTTSIYLYFGHDTREGKHVDWSQEPHASVLSNNTQIKEMYINGTEEEMDAAVITNLENFFKSIAGNRSIERFSADLQFYFGDNHDTLITRSLSLPSLLVPFINNNDNLNWLELNIDLTDCMTMQLASALKYRGSRGCSLKALGLGGCRINDTKAVALFRALSEHTNLKHLNMSSNDFRYYGCMALKDLIMDSNVKLEGLSLNWNYLNDASIKVLGNILKNNSTLKDISVSNNRNVTPDGWKELSDALKSPNLVLKSLALDNNNLDADATVALARGLLENETLRVLNLDRVPIGSTGLQAISSLLCNRSKPHLKDLCVSRAGIGDQGVRALAHAMVGNRTLRKLAICGNPLVTDECWKELMRSMFRTKSSMRVFECRENSLSQETAVLVANMLAGSGKRMKRLYIGSLGYTASTAFSNTMCDTSSVMNCFLSNHTLRSLHENGYTLADCTRSLLYLNQIKKSNAEVARLKIIYIYFEDGTKVKELLEFELNVLPYVIAWIGRDIHGVSLLNELVKGVPSLFDLKAHVRGSAAKRQRMH